jgi:hypothetical protein
MHPDEPWRSLASLNLGNPDRQQAQSAILGFWPVHSLQDLQNVSITPPHFVDKLWVVRLLQSGHPEAHALLAAATALEA